MTTIVSDPYTDINRCIARLTEEWRKYGKIIIALDYDDTIFDFHGKGYEYNGVIQTVRRAAEKGAYICIFTGSPPEKYDGIRANCAALDIPVASINTNPFPMPFGNHGKMYYNILLDDRAGLGQSLEILSQTLENLNQPTTLTTLTT